MYNNHGTDIINDYNNCVIMTTAELNRFSDIANNIDFGTLIYGELTKYISDVTWFPFNLNKWGIDRHGELILFADKHEHIEGTDWIGNIRTRTNASQPSSRARSDPKLVGFIHCDWFETYQDYEPYSKYELYLPFFGNVSVKASDIANQYLYVLLKLDFQSGAGTYYICTDSTDKSAGETDNHRFIQPLDRVLSTHNAYFGIHQKFGQGGSVDMTRALISASVNLAGTAISKGLVSNLSMEIPNNAYIQLPSMKNPDGSFMPMMDWLQASRPYYHQRGEIDARRDAQNRNKASALIAGIAETLNAINVEPSSSSTSGSSTLDTITRRVQFIHKRANIVERPYEYNRLMGLPYGNVRNLGTMFGFTRISSLNLEDGNIKTSTITELNMIRDMLMSGVLLDTDYEEIYVYDGDEYYITYVPLGMTFREYINSNFNIQYYTPYSRARFNNIGGYVYSNGNVLSDGLNIVNVDNVIEGSYNVYRGDKYYIQPGTYLFNEYLEFGYLEFTFFEILFKFIYEDQGGYKTAANSILIDKNPGTSQYITATMDYISEDGSQLVYELFDVDGQIHYNWIDPSYRYITIPTRAIIVNRNFKEWFDSHTTKVS